MVGRSFSKEEKPLFGCISPSPVVLERRRRLLRGEEAEAALGGGALLAEFVVGREARRVGVLSGRAVRRRFLRGEAGERVLRRLETEGKKEREVSAARLQGVRALAGAVVEEAEVHCGQGEMKRRILHYANGAPLPQLSVGKVGSIALG